MRKSRKIELNSIPTVILTFVFIALIGGVGLIIMGELQADDSVTSELCSGTFSFNESSGQCANGTTEIAINQSNNAYGFMSGGEAGIMKLGSKLGLVGTVLILSIIIGLVVTYFAVRGV